MVRSCEVSCAGLEMFCAEVEVVTEQSGGVLSKVDDWCRRERSQSDVGRS